MIKSVNEIIAITKEANKNKMAERHDTTMMFLNGKVATEIEKAAKDCRTDVRFRVSDLLDRDLMKRVLEESGYEVTVKGFEIKISWLMAYLKG